VFNTAGSANLHTCNKDWEDQVIYARRWRLVAAISAAVILAAL
jgi:hypothetical protein